MVELARILAKPWCGQLLADCRIERLYRDVRLFRIYEGTSQIQQIIFARETLERGGERSIAATVRMQRDDDRTEWCWRDD